jgi:hypothetical protein
MLRPVHAVLLAASLFALTPLAAPAEAQTVIRACVVNNSGVVIRSRFAYNDWQGTRRTSDWVTSALGSRNCVTLQDVSALNMLVEVNDIGRWVSGCSQNLDGRRTATLFVTGSIFGTSCSVEQ